MSRPAPQSAEDRAAKRKRADAPLDFAPSAALASSATSTGPSDSATAELQTQLHSPLSAAQRCHIDALHCVFAFLDLAELLPALHSCRGWLAAGRKEPSRGLKLFTKPKSIASLAASPLRHHVINLNIIAAVNLDQLRQLRTLSRLKAMSVWVDAGELEAFLESAGDGGDARQQRAQLLSAAFPSQLHSVELVIDRNDFSSLHARQALVDALPSAPSLRSADLDMSTFDLDLSPLLQLSQLSDLRMGDSPSLTQCAVVKQLAALTTLDIDRCDNSWEDNELLELFRPPHSLQQLEQVPMIDTLCVEPPLLAALQSLPALTQLEPMQIEPECWAGLGGFAQLRQLTVCWDDEFTAAHRSALQSSLNALPHLSDLTLGLPLDSQSDGPLLALRLPALRSLYLNDVRLPSLSFLQHSPLIEELTLNSCVQMDTDDVMHWLRTAAPPLRRLVLCRSVHLSADQQSLLRPPSALLPALTNFSFSEPR